MIKCKHCKLFKRCENRVSGEFVENVSPITMPDGKKLPGLPFSIESDTGVPMCQHKFCFANKMQRTPANGVQLVKMRVAGQAQLNKHNDCSHFKRSWWKTILF